MLFNFAKISIVFNFIILTIYFCVLKETFKQTFFKWAILAGCWFYWLNVFCATPEKTKTNIIKKEMKNVFSKDFIKSI